MCRTSASGRSPPKRHTAAGWSGWAQLCDEHGTLLERDYARAWLPETVKPGAMVDVPIEIVAPKKPGMLKFDLVEAKASTGSKITDRRPL